MAKTFHGSMVTIQKWRLLIVASAEVENEIEAEELDMIKTHIESYLTALSSPAKNAQVAIEHELSDSVTMPVENLMRPTHAPD